MKKVFVILAAVAMLAVVSTSCGKGCHCYFKTDVYHLTPVYEDENMGKEDCNAMQAELNEEYGMNVVKCK